MAESLGLNFGPELLQNLPPETSAGIITLVTVLKTVGIVFIIYFIFQIVNIILNIRRNRRIKRMEKKLDQVEHKVDKLLGRNKNQSHNNHIKQKNKGKKKN